MPDQQEQAYEEARVRAKDVQRGMQVRWRSGWLEVVGAVNTSAGRRTVNVRLPDGSTESRHTDVDAEYTVRRPR